MSQISHIQAAEILDSRGNPTLCVTVTTDSGHQGKAMVPSGASTGEHEAVELRDNDPKRYRGKGVLKAVANVNEAINQHLREFDVLDQKGLDRAMIELDGTDNKAHLGANAILGVSLASAYAAAQVQQKALFEHLSTGSQSLPIPMINILNGGEHANNTIDFQEFMIRPLIFDTFSEKIRVGSEIFHALKDVLKSQNMSTAVGDEGGFAPSIDSNEETLKLLIQAIEKAGYRPAEDVTIALDCAASFFYEEGNYLIDKKKGSIEHRTASEQVAYLAQLVEAFPIDSIEDGLDENDWKGWAELTQRLGNKIQLVGDDLFVTQKALLQRGIDEGVANSILIKLNQVGTLTETLETMDLAKQAGYTTVVSHRSGETEDVTIADLSVATNAQQIKTGSVCRSERTAKYNRLLAIEQMILSNKK